MEEIKLIGKQLKMIIVEMIMTMLFVIKSNLYSMLVIIELMSPFIILKISKSLGIDILNISMIALWLLIYLVIYILKRLVNKQSYGYEFPVPRKRFTSCDGVGEYSINNDDIQEVILYLADVEDFLEKTGRLRK